MLLIVSRRTIFLNLTDLHASSRAFGVMALCCDVLECSERGSRHSSVLKNKVTSSGHAGAGGGGDGGGVEDDGEDE